MGVMWWGLRAVFACAEEEEEECDCSCFFGCFLVLFFFSFGFLWWKWESMTHGIKFCFSSLQVQESTFSFFAINFFLGWVCSGFSCCFFVHETDVFVFLSPLGEKIIVQKLEGNFLASWRKVVMGSKLIMKNYGVAFTSILYFF